MLRQEIQLPDGWCRQHGPASVLLQSGSCWQEVVEIHLLGPVEHWHHQRLHSLEEDEPPPPHQQSCLLTEDMEDEAYPQHGGLKTWKLRLIHNMVDNYVSRREHRCEPAVDNLSVERVFIYPQQSSGTAASPVVGPKENLQAMCPPEDKGSEGAIHLELFWLLRVQSLSLQNWLFYDIPSWHALNVDNASHRSQVCVTMNRSARAMVT